MLPMTRRNAWLNNNIDDSFGRLRREMTGMFDQFFGHDGGFLPQASSPVPFTIWEDDDRFWIEADLPGVAESDVEVTVHNGLLYVRGERKPEEGRNALYNGRSFGRFERVVQLPAAVATDNIEATLVNGVLRITLHKAPEAKPKRITVQTS